MVDLKDPNTKKQLKKIVCKTFGRKVLHSINNPKTTFLVSLEEIFEYAERVSKIITNKRPTNEINYKWFKNDIIKKIKKDEETYKLVWNKAIQERDYKWSRMYKEHAAKENSLILKENKKLNNKMNQVEILIEREREKIINQFMMGIYLDDLDKGQRLYDIYSQYNKEGYLKRAQNKYNKGEILFPEDKAAEFEEKHDD